MIKARVLVERDMDGKPLYKCGNCGMPVEPEFYELCWCCWVPLYVDIVRVDRVLEIEEKIAALRGGDTE